MRGSALVGSATFKSACFPASVSTALFIETTAAPTGPCTSLPLSSLCWPQGPSAIAPSVIATTTTVTRIRSIFQRYIICPASRPMTASMMMPNGTSGRAERIAARMPTKAPASSIR